MNAKITDANMMGEAEDDNDVEVEVSVELSMEKIIEALGVAEKGLSAIYYGAPEGVTRADVLGVPAVDEIFDGTFVILGVTVDTRDLLKIVAKEEGRHRKVWARVMAGHLRRPSLKFAAEEIELGVSNYCTGGIVILSGAYSLMMAYLRGEEKVTVFAEKKEAEKLKEMLA